MRMDRMTSRLQAALADAHSLAVGKDHNYIQPVHLLAVLLEDKASGVAQLLAQPTVVELVAHQLTVRRDPRQRQLVS